VCVRQRGIENLIIRNECGAWMWFAFGSVIDRKVWQLMESFDGVFGTCRRQRKVCVDDIVGGK